MALFLSDFAKMLLVFCIIGLFPTAFAARVADKIYQEIQGDMACFKRFNGTHEVGCTSAFGGNVGVLYIPEDIEDIKWADEKGPHSPYIFGLTPSLFTSEVLMILKDSKNVNGIVLFNPDNQTYPEQDSPVSTCPSHEYGIYNESSSSEYKDYCTADAKESWNPVGTSLLYKSFNFPIFLIQDEESVNAITKCYNTYNRDSLGNYLDWPLCSLQLQSNMYGATNSEVCIRRTNSFAIVGINYCGPIHDYNIHGSLNEMNGELEDSSVIVVAARADAASMFDNISPGADSAVTGVVTLLAVAKALSKYKDDFKDANKNVLFILFEGETWDYLGSASMTYDMSESSFPFKFNPNDLSQVSNFNFSHIDYFIELSQLGIQDANDESQIYLYTDPISNTNTNIQEINDKIRKAMEDAGGMFNVNVKSVTDDKTTLPYPLPPASLQTFLKYFNISGAVLSDHSFQYKNKFYQSYLDNYKNVKFISSINNTNSSDDLHKHLYRIASTVSQSVYTMATQKSDKIDVNAVDENLISDLLLCFLRNVNCTLFREHVGQLLEQYIASYKYEYFQPRPAKMYSSVQGGEDILTNITLYLLGDFLGEEVLENEHECWSNSTSAVQMFFLPKMGENGTCIKSTPRLHSANSPAFRIPGYNFSSGLYPTWTESVWDTTKVRLFLKPSPVEEVGLVVGGCLFVILTVVLAYWADARAATLFVSSPAPTQC